MATEYDARVAQDLLSDVLVGATVNGLRFGVVQITFDQIRCRGEPYVLLSSAWRIFPSRPESIPRLADEEHTEAHDELQQAISLRHKEVSDVEILCPWPHLVLTFADGAALFVNGESERYDAWNAGIAFAPPGHDLQVIACPGGGLAIFGSGAGESSNGG